MAYLFIFLAPLLNFLLLEVFFFKHNLFYAVLAANVLVILLAVRQIAGRKIVDREFWNFSIFPVIFSSALAGYCLLLVDQYLVQFLFIVDLGMLFFYLKNIYHGEKNEFFQNVSAFGNFLAIFFCFALAYGLNVFLTVPVWLLIAALAALIALIVYQVLWANQVSPAAGAIYIFTSCLILAQISWAVYFLPFNYNALGLILAIGYYLIIGLIKSYFSGKLNGRYVRLYLFSSLGALALILLTAKWA